MLEDEEEDAQKESSNSGTAASSSNGAAAITVEDIAAGIHWPDPATETAFWERPPRDAPVSIGGAANHAAADKDRRSLHVVHMTAEMAPIAKV